MLKRIKIILILVFVVSIVSNAQKNLQTTAGTFLIQNYSPKEYKANAQIFGITQDKRGLIYCANQNGVLEYDGVSWSTIQVGEDEKKVLSLERNFNGDILVGADGEFGVLKSDSLGGLQYVSLLEQYDLEDIGRITQILLHQNKIVLKSYEQVFVLEEGEGSLVIPAESEFDRMFSVGKELFFTQKDLGLYRLIDNQLKQVPGGYIFSNKPIANITNFGGKKLIVTSENGLFELTDKGEIVELHILEGVSVFSVVKAGENLSIGTFTNGIIVINDQLETIYKIGIEKGIVDATVRCQYMDYEGNLWLGTNVGMSKISVNEPILNYRKEVGIKSGIESISKFNNAYYFTTQNGIYTLEDSEISKVEGVDRDCYGLSVFRYKSDSMLMIAEVNSLLSFDANKNLKNVEAGGPYECKQSPLDSSELIVLHYNGIAKLKYENGNFKEKRYIRDFTESEPFNFIIEDDGTIWIGTLDGSGYGVYKTHVNALDDSIPEFKHYGEDAGLTRGGVYLFNFQGSLYCTSDEGLHKFVDDKFEICNDFGFDFSSGRYGVHRINADEENNVWMVIFDSINNYKIGYSELIDGEYIWNDQPFERYSDAIIHAIYHDHNGITWLGGPNGLMRFSRNIKTDYSVPFSSLIRSVKYGTREYFLGTEYSGGDKTNTSLTFNYSSNKAVGFEFSAPTFIDERLTDYSYFLEGQDETWSNWDHRTMKEYNLDHGKYTFHVKARNVYGNESEEATYMIVILPPWYQTTWAYVLYFIGFLVFVYIVIKLSIRRIKQQNIRLEGIVDERTKEVVVQKQAAEKQRDFANEQQKIAEHQRELVEEKNKEILDSISYAKRLQDAILPPDKLVNEKLPNSFILYKPKDIVAGDFYWMESIAEDEVLFAAADCTGHGVPGAMVSVVCSNALDRSVKEFGFTNTGKVLDKVTDLVIETFEKSEDEVKDGMDISLCKMSYDNSGEKASIQYAGANNPLWLISKREDIGCGDSVNIADGGFYLHEIKATKQPVGQYAERKPFVSHDLVLEKGEVFYLFTDGFADQFGGERGKKYKYKPFKRFLLAHAESSMKEQKSIIDTEFEKWMGEYEQVDDVCIIGVRI